MEKNDKRASFLIHTHLSAVFYSVRMHRMIFFLSFCVYYKLVILVHNYFFMFIIFNQKHKPLGWAIIPPLQQSQQLCPKGTLVFAHMVCVQCV